jgi:hypothetical protein
MHQKISSAEKSITKSEEIQDFVLELIERMLFWLSGDSSDDDSSDSDSSDNDSSDNERPPSSASDNKQDHSEGPETTSEMPSNSPDVPSSVDTA